MARDLAAAAKVKAEEERATAAANFEAAKEASAVNALDVTEAYRRWNAAAKAFEVRRKS